MDKKPPGIHSPKSKPTPELLSAFEMSINLEFQVSPLPRGATPPKVGELCPNCLSARLDYDGMLNLHCPDCGYTLAGCFT